MATSATPSPLIFELLRQWTSSLRIHLSDWIFIHRLGFSPNKTTPSLLNSGSEWSSTLRRSRCSEFGFMKRSRVLFWESSAGREGWWFYFYFRTCAVLGFFLKEAVSFCLKRQTIFDASVRTCVLPTSPPVPLTNFELFSASSQVVELFWTF